MALVFLLYVGFVFLSFKEYIYLFHKCYTSLLMILLLDIINTG